MEIEYIAHVCIHERYYLYFSYYCFYYSFSSTQRTHSTNCCIYSIAGDDGGTVAAGDGVVFKMNKPTVEEVDGDVTSFFTRKGYYAYALQAFCDARCKFLYLRNVAQVHTTVLLMF